MLFANCSLKTDSYGVAIAENYSPCWLDIISHLSWYILQTSDLESFNTDISIMNSSTIDMFHMETMIFLRYYRKHII